MRVLIPASASAPSHDPLSAGEFADRLDPLAVSRPGPLAVAVSGGPDSVALFHLADGWARKHGRPLHAYTVDHGLRSEARAEAAAVAELARRYGRPHRVLVWRGSKPVHGLQAAARTARYALLTEACDRDGVAALLLGHHLDDQAETLLHRIGRDTGPDGLAGMAPAREVDGIWLLRPLLGVPKARLVATCRAGGLAWAEDPSNRDPRFARSELRSIAAPLADLGVTADRLGRLAAAMASVRDALDGFTSEWMAAHGTAQSSGSIRLDRAALAAAPTVLRRRLVERTLRAVGGAAYPARGDRLERLLDWAVATDRTDGVRTLGGCRVELAGASVTIVRDWRQAAAPVVVAPRRRARWDGRFDIENATTAPVRVGVCGEEGWRRWRRIVASAPRPALDEAMPHAARLALPAVVDLDGVVALPHLVADAPAPSGWVGDEVRFRFRPTVPLPSSPGRSAAAVDIRPSLPCNGRQAT